jgi:Flp pilus assembly protein TadB
VATYADPSADLVREALRVKEVQRLELEAALDEVAERYRVEDLHRLADTFRIGRRYGTGMAAPLLALVMYLVFSPLLGTLSRL